MGPGEDEQGFSEQMSDIRGSNTGYPDQGYGSAEYSSFRADEGVNYSSNPPEPNMCRADGTGESTDPLPQSPYRTPAEHPPDSENFPNWVPDPIQHGAPTRPVSPDPHVEESPPEDPTNQSEDSTLETVTKVVIALGLSIAIVGTVVLALADPEPASKLALAGLSVAEIEALGAALGFAATVSP